MRLFTRLGFGTGYSTDSDGYNHAIRAGCETLTTDWKVPDWDKQPRFVKSPFLSFSLARVPAVIDHVLIPVRDLDDVHRSRIKSGLIWPDLPSQRAHLAQALGECVASCVSLDIPYTIIPFRVLAHLQFSLFGVLKDALPADFEHVSLAHYTVAMSQLKETRSGKP